MDKVKEFFNKPLGLGVICLLAGMIFGLVVLGWGLFPVKWTDAAPSDLHMDYKRDYMCMMIDSYIRNQNDALVQLRWDGLGEEANDLLNTLTPTVCRFESAQEIQAFAQVMGYQGIATERDGMGLPPVNETEAFMEPMIDPMQEPQEEEPFSILPLALLMLLTLVVGAVLVFLLIRRSKTGGGVSPKVKKDSAMEAAGMGMSQSAFEETDAFHSKEVPLAQFMTTFRQGDDLYDDSFSIDSINGEFLGECGVGIAETIGVGEPKKVTALEVWLFDKNDIQTVTKVLLSEHASNDQAIRQRLLSKGEPVLVEPGMRFVMETASLQLEARVIDLVYARGPLPENSYFSRLTLEISVWAK